MDRLEEASSPRHYIALIITIIIGLVGVYIRFADFKYCSIVGDAIMFLASISMFRIVFTIMK